MISAPRRSVPACWVIERPPTTVAIAQVHGRRVRRQRVRDLLGELTRGDEDQGERGARLGAAARGAGEQREAEGEGLAGAGAATAEDVAAGEGVGERGAWIGKGSVTPCAASVFSRASGMSRSANASTGGQRGREALGQREFAAATGRLGAAGFFAAPFGWPPPATGPFRARSWSARGQDAPGVRSDSYGNAFLDLVTHARTSAERPWHRQGPAAEPTGTGVPAQAGTRTFPVRAPAVRFACETIRRERCSPPAGPSGPA